jgi:hypothetical protein
VVLVGLGLKKEDRKLPFSLGLPARGRAASKGKFTKLKDKFVNRNPTSRLLRLAKLTNSSTWLKFNIRETFQFISFWLSFHSI